MALEDLDRIKEDIPYNSPVDPAELSNDDEFQFDCHPGISCFNECCRNIDITILPYDILRLKNRLKMSSSQWVNSYTVPFAMDQYELPGLKLATREGKSVVEDVYFKVKETHCEGHNEPKTQTVGEYRKSQGVEKYDEMNREWRDIILKKRSSGPTVGAPSARSLQLFDICSYDIDTFEKFVKSDNFTKLFKLDDETRKEIENDQEALLQFSARFLKQVLFGEMRIQMNDEAIDERVENRKERMAQSEQDVVDEKLQKMENDFDTE